MSDDFNFQHSFRTVKQGLSNVRANDIDTLVERVVEFREKALQEILATEEVLWAASNVAPLTVPQQAPVAAPAGDIPPTSAPVGGKSNGADTTCPHGARKQVIKPTWTGWFCPLGKETPGSCTPSFEEKRKR